MTSIQFTPKTRQRGHIALVLLAAMVAAGVAGLVYANSRHAYFNSDDFVLIEAVRTGQTARSLFLANWLKQEGQGGFYRPLVILSWMADHALHGDSPGGYHLTNIALHALNAFLLLFLVQRITGSLGLGLSTSLLFGLHPALTEAVAWLSGRTDSLCAAFILLSLLSWRFYLDHGPRRAYLAALLAFVLALMSKEEAVMLPLLAVLLARVPFASEDAQRCRRVIDRPGLPLLGFFAVLAAYLAFRFSVLGGVGGYGAARHFTINADLLQNLRRYVNWLAQPAGIGPRSGLGFAVLAATGAALTVLLVWHPRTRFATLWVLIALAPAATLSRPQYLYVPAMGFCLLLSLALFPEGEPVHRRLMAGAVLCGLLVYYGAVVRDQNRAWALSGGTALGTLQMLAAMAPDPNPSDRWFFADLPFNRETGFGVFQNGLQEALNMWFGPQAPQAVKLARAEDAADGRLALRDRLFQFREGRLDDLTPRLQPGARSADVPLPPPGAMTLDVTAPPVTLTVNPPVTARALELHSLAANSFRLPQGFPIAGISVRDEYGHELTAVEVRMGEHTAEWAIDRPGLKDQISHQRPPIASGWIEGAGSPDPQPGYVYRGRWLWDHPFTVGEIVVTFHALPETERDNVVLEIRRIALEHGA